MVKTIVVKDWTWRELTHMKANIMAPDLDSVIEYLIVGNKIEGESKGNDSPDTSKFPFDLEKKK